jgi:hypothetical protein
MTQPEQREELQIANAPLLWRLLAVIVGRVPSSGVSPQVPKVEALGAQLITADSLAC